MSDKPDTARDAAVRRRIQRELGQRQRAVEIINALCSGFLIVACATFAILTIVGPVLLFQNAAI